MRKSALAAAAVCIGMALAATASARVWNDDAGRVGFDSPSSWTVDVQRTSPDTIVLVGNADQECFGLAVPNSGTRSASATRVRAGLQNQIENSAWESLANAVSPMFPSRNARVTNKSVDTSGFWPIQRAEITGAERPVTAALISRPGMDISAFCWTYGGPDATATYEEFFRSLSHPNDATWRAEIEAAAAAAPAPTPAPTQPQ
jgi:hypothetical protein